MPFASQVSRWRKDTDKDISVTQEMEERIRVEQIALLNQNAKVGFVVSILVGALLIAALSNQFSLTRLFAWYLILILVTLVRYYLVYRYTQGSSEERRNAHWDKRFIWATGCAGLTWGLSIIVLFPPDSVAHQFFIALTLAGLVGGSVAIFSARYLVYLAFSLTILVPVILRFLLENDAVHIALAAMVVVFLAGMAITSRNTEHAIRSALMLRFDNQELNDQITKRKSMEKALTISEARFRDLTGLAADFYWELDADYRFTVISERFYEITRTSKDGIIGQSCQDVFAQHSEGTDALADFLNRLISHQAFENIELEWSNQSAPCCILTLSAKPILNGDDTFRGYRGVGRDVTEEHRAAQLIRHQATHDELTGLVNRREFMRRLENAFEHFKQEGAVFTLCYIDLDQFKIVNDTLGHAAGDTLLKEFSGLLHGRLRTRDTLSRVGGDEFALLLENCQLQAGIQITESLLSMLTDFRFHLGTREFQIGASVGVVSVDEEIDSALQVLSHADLACYTAKQLGRNRIHVYKAGDHELTRVEHEMALVSTLKDALRNNRFKLYAQPVFSLADDKVEYLELLLRLEESPGKLIPSKSLISAAERFGIMHEIDRWVIRTSLAAYARQHDDASPVTFSVNLSGNCLTDSSLPDWITGQFAQAKVSPSCFCFEITEMAAIRNLNQASEVVGELKARGFRFALDDFGSGLSSFAYIKHLPVDYLKIDGGFVRDMAKDTTARAMVVAMNEMGHALGIKTIAEHVENRQAMALLKKIGVDFAQGNLLARPAPYNFNA